MDIQEIIDSVSNGKGRPVIKITIEYGCVVALPNGGEVASVLEEEKLVMDYSVDMPDVAAEFTAALKRLLDSIDNQEDEVK